MKKLKNILLIIITFIIQPSIIGNTQNNLYADTRNRINIGVIVSSLNDPYVLQIKQNLEKIQNNNKDKINLTFFDAKKNEAIQYEILDMLLRDNIDLLLVNLVNTNTNVVENFIDKVKQKDIPLIFFNAEPPMITDKMKNYSKFLIITTDPKESGTIQGKLIVDQWNKNKSTIDKNKDNIMQYIMLQGELNNVGAIGRTKASIDTIKNSGIKTQKLALLTSNWNQELAKASMLSLFLRYNDNIEVIISNNDAMAIGAIEALQTYGYNKGDPKKYIPVFGIDGIPAAQDLIKKGFMTNTVVENPNDTTEALYTIGINLVNNKPPLENTTYKFDKTETIIRIPYSEYIK